MEDSVDPRSITSITIWGICSNCFGDEDNWVKATKDADTGKTFLHHNKCGWCRVRDIDWEDFVAESLAAGYIYYTDEHSLISPADIRPWMTSILYNPSKSNKGCFVATATFNNYMATEVIYLQYFRDNVLSKTASGRTFVKAYWKISPFLTTYISKSTFVSTLVREVLLNPLIRVLRYFSPNP